MSGCIIYCRLNATKLILSGINIKASRETFVMVLNHWYFALYQYGLLGLGFDHHGLLSLASPDEPCCQAAHASKAPRRSPRRASMNLDRGEFSSPQQSYSTLNPVSPNKTRAWFSSPRHSRERFRARMTFPLRFTLFSSCQRLRSTSRPHTAIVRATVGFPRVFRFRQAQTLKCGSCSQLVDVGQNLVNLLGYKLERCKSVMSMPRELWNFHL